MGDRDNLPELPKGWVWTPLPNLGELNRGKSKHRPRNDPKLFEGKYPFIQTGDVRNSNGIIKSYSQTYNEFGLKQSRLWSENTLCITIAANIAETALLGIQACFPDSIVGFSSDERICAVKYVFYFIKTVKDKLESYAPATAQKNINLETLRNLFIPLPPITEQHRIVAKIEELFSELDAGVELLKKLKAKLKRYRQAVLKAAVEGKLTKDWREAHQGELEPASVLLERILKERREKWEAQQLAQMKAKGKTPKDDSWKLKYKEPVTPDISDLPELPEGWVWASFGQLVQESQNGLSKRKGLHGTPIHVLRLADIVNGKISATEPRDILLTDEEIQSYRLQPNDLVCIRVNGSEKLVGRVIIFKEKESWAFCDHFIRFRLVSNFLCLSFLSKLFNTDAVRKYIEHHKVSSAGQNTVSQTTVAAIPIPLPSLEEQNAIDEEIERRLSVTEELEKVVDKNLKRAEKLRQSILKKAFEGKLVPQDPTDEPADKLLERIKAEKTKREAEAKTKKKQKQPGKSQQLELF